MEVVMTQLFRFVTLLMCVMGAAAIASRSSAPLSIDPAYEGIYKFSLDCPTAEPVCHEMSYLRDVNLTVINTPSGISAILTRNDYSMDLYHFEVHGVVNGETIYGDSYHSAGRLAEFRVNLRDRSLTLIDLLAGRELNAVGTQVFNTSALYQSPASPINVASLEGDFEVESPKHKGLLRVRETQNPDFPFVATYWLPSANLRFDFSQVTFAPDTGTLTLFHRSGSRLLKWTVFLNRTPQGAVEGKGISMAPFNGTYYEFTLKRAR